MDVQVLRKAGPLGIKFIELFGPAAPFAEFVKCGRGPHHLAFLVSDVGHTCVELSGLGARILATSQPGEAFDDHLVAFAFLGAGLNAEIVDTDERRARLPEPTRPPDGAVEETA